MGTGSVTNYIDTAQIALYLFWLFFAGLVYYLRMEDKREGYPMIGDGPSDPTFGFPMPPAYKPRLLEHPEYDNSDRVERSIAAVPTSPWPGAPLEPTGNPMVDGVGPAAWASRKDLPDLLHEDGKPKILPLRNAPAYGVAAQDYDPRGFEVIAADGIVAGKVVDVWVDRAEFIFRYLEVAVNAPGETRNILLPVPLSVIKGKAGQVHVASVLASHFADVPVLKNPDQVTLLEEDRVSAYFGGGHLYATPDRLGPII